MMGLHPSTISRIHNIKICCILVGYKNYVDDCSKGVVNSRSVPFMASQGK